VEMEEEERLRVGDDDGPAKVRHLARVNPYEGKPEPAEFPGGRSDKTVLIEYGSMPHIAICVYDNM
ncbi:hypothetical protein A2U01_0080868, partial [Trifolium medium]|nr:hypothetical protein [Trifolium medium]